LILKLKISEILVSLKNSLISAWSGKGTMVASGLHTIFRVFMLDGWKVDSYVIISSLPWHLYNNYCAKNRPMLVCIKLVILIVLKACPIISENLFSQ
jgi:hypothetical protein